MSYLESECPGALAGCNEQTSDAKTPLRVLITGASGGIGAETALFFAQNGQVGLHYNSNASSVKKTACLIKIKGGTSTLLQGDVTNPAEISRIVEEFVAWSGGIDVLINNAGSMLQRCTIEDMSLDLWQQTYRLNVESTFLFTQAVIPHMKRQGGGSIINITSIAATTGGSVSASHYASAKAAVSCFTLSAAKELAPHNIRVNAVAPGFIVTPFHDGITSPEAMDNMKNTTPLNRLGNSKDVAEAIHFLSSQASSFITGTVLDVNGGLLMRS